jgi:RsiW-degrading membrane proteinase PrsW (M82 family)
MFYFYSYLILFVGGCYLFYRYNSLADKSAFFKSSLFVSITGSLGILAASVLIINLFSTATPTPAPKAAVKDSIQIDTTYRWLATSKPLYHYELASIIHTNYAYYTHLTSVEKNYKTFVNGSDDSLSSIGHFGLGALALWNEKYDDALNHFNQSPYQNLPYLHFCKGEAHKGKKDLKSALDEYALELKVPGGNFNQCFSILVDHYEADKNFKGLKDLLAYHPTQELFPDNLARTTSLFNGDVIDYLYWTFITIANKTSLNGFIAALAILAVWLYYLFKVDIFNPGKLVNLLLMFFGGVLAILLIMIFNDAHHTLINWSPDGSFFNDLFYSVIMIGMPEEFTKIFPLLVLLAFKRSFKEPIDYIIYASASALGFAFVENLLYFQNVTQGIIHGRAYFSVIGHMADSSFVAYGFVLSKFKFKKTSSYFILVPVCFLAGSFTHGLYDFLLFHNLRFIFFVQFIFFIQVWMIILNNCLNNSTRFSYKIAGKVERSRLVMTFALTGILALEYLIVGFSEGDHVANQQLLVNVGFSGFLLIFFSSNLSSFNLIRGYWRDVYFSSREKRGYGTLTGPTLFSSWYLVNSIRAQNYVGMRINLWNDPYNQILVEVMDGTYEGTILDRIILYEDDDPDPHWFIVKLERPIPFESDNQKYVLVKLRNQNDSLTDDDEVQVFFKAIPEIALLKTAKPQKERFPFYGWAVVSRVGVNS